MEIAHIVKPHPETGLNNSKLGIWLFLASEVMLFGALFSSYVILRVGAATWPEGSQILNVPLATLNTLVLISSSVTIILSWASLKLNKFDKFRLYMGCTIGLSLVFLVIKYIEYTAKFSHGLYPSTSTFFALYFTLTGLHAIHIIGGVVVNGYLLGPGSKLWRDQPEMFTNRVEAAGLYWHFVDLVWIFLFPVLYLL